jgi:hypothetical protein
MSAPAPNAPPVRRLPLGPAYAANQVNATVFRVSAVVSAGPFQYATYYDPEGRVIVAQRRLDSGYWDRATLPITANIKDAHNGVVIGVSSDGSLHLSYDHHGHDLRYRRSARPHDIRSFGELVPMTGRTENRVTYPQFVPAPDGTLYFFYRDGSSGNGSLCLNRYDAARGAWDVLHHPLIDGAGICNPYWWRPAFGPDGSLHVAWCWRDTPDASTNHDICYIRSYDAGRTWTTIEGSPVALPVTPDTAPVADPIPVGSNLLNQCSAAVDAEGRPHLAHYHNDGQGIPQYIHLWHDGARWQRNVVSQRTQSFSLAGGGTLRIPISRPEIAVTPDGTVLLVTRDETEGGGIRVFRSTGRDYAAPWQPIDLTPLGEDLGHWEPTYDTVRWHASGVLSLFALSVRQGNHETVTDYAPQEAYILETTLR